MLTKKDAMEAYNSGKCRKLFAYTADDVGPDGFVPGEWLHRHLLAANNVNNTFFVYDGDNCGLYEIIE